jgi:hypothetical protein
MQNAPQRNPIMHWTVRSAQEAVDAGQWALEPQASIASEVDG